MRKPKTYRRASNDAGLLAIPPSTPRWPLLQVLIVLILAANCKRILPYCLYPVYGQGNTRASESLWAQTGYSIVLWLGYLVFLQKTNTASVILWTDTFSLCGMSLTIMIWAFTYWSSILGPSLGPALALYGYSTLLGLTACFAASNLCLCAFFPDHKRYLENEKDHGVVLPIASFLLDICMYVMLIALQKSSSYMMAGCSAQPHIMIGSQAAAAIGALSCYTYYLMRYQDRSKTRIAKFVFFLLIPVVICATISLNTALLNMFLARDGFAVVARQESITGYVSVLDNVQEGYRALRCDHSLLGGSWLRTRPGSPVSALKEPIYTIFVMLEAVRLIQRVSEDALRGTVPTAGPKALFIGLGIGTSPAAFIQHDINTTIIELDPVVADYAMQYFDLPDVHDTNQSYTLIIDDAIAASTSMQASHGGSFDYIIHDVFTGGTEPLDLFTAPFLLSLRSLMTMTGSIAINYAGDLRSPSCGAVIRTISAVFPACRAFRESPLAKTGKTDEEGDMTNLVIFCLNQLDEATDLKGQKHPFYFRTPVEADFLHSDARRKHLLPQHEVDIQTLLESTSTSTSASAGVLMPASINKLDRAQRESAIRHWRLMRTVLPDRVWQIW